MNLIRIILLIFSIGFLSAQPDDKHEKAGRSYEENVRIAARYPVDDLKKAINKGDTKTLKRLLDEGVPASCPLPWSKDQWEGYPPPTDYPILLAAGSEYLEIVGILLDYGANPETHGGEGNFTPLHAANDVEVAKLLVSRGADVNARDDRGGQPIHNAAFVADICENLRVDGVSSLGLIKFLIKHGADPLAKDHVNCQPIHLAARGNTAEVVNLFLERGAKVDASIYDKDGRSDNGWQPLHFAANREDGNEALDVADLLIRKGADVNAVSAEGETPLHLSKNAAMTKLLLEHGAKMNVMSTKITKMLPIHNFALRGDVESIRLLLDRGADPNALTGASEPRIPLDLAVFFNRRRDAVDLLLSRGAKPTQRTLEAAEQSKNGEMIRLIRARLDTRPKRPPHRR